MKERERVEHEDVTWLKEARISSMQLKSSHTCVTLLITPCSYWMMEEEKET